MFKVHTLFQFVVTALATMFCLVTSQAQAVVYISAKTGADSNPCTFAAPCRTLSFAHSAVTANGRIVIADSGDYSNVTITKSVTIEAAPGALPVVTNPTAGVTIQINAANTDKVMLRGLHIKGTTATNVTGIGNATNGSLFVDRCLVEGFATQGIIVSGAANFTLHNSSVRNNQTGVNLTVNTAGTLSTTIDNCIVERNTSHGILLSPLVNANLRATIRNTKIANNGASGIRAISDVTASSVSCLIENITAVGNVTGISAERTFTELFVAKSTIVGNTTGLSRINLANILTDLTNTVEGNTTNGTFSETFAHQ